LAVGPSVRLAKAADLMALLPRELPREFHTGMLAESCKIDRPSAQRIAYCLRQTRAVEQIGKQGNALVYRLPARRGRRPTDEAA
jgi:hypothetical protein